MQIKEYLKRKKFFWDQIADKKITRFSKFYKDTIIKTYKFLIPEENRILEIGSGNGDLLAALKPSHGVGIDVSENMVRLAKEKHPNINFYQMDAENFNLDKNKFDYIILSDVVNELWDLQKVLEKIKPNCTSRTRIIFNYFSHLWKKPLEIGSVFGLNILSKDLNWFTKQDINNLLNLTGYSTIKSFSEIILPIKIPLVSNLINRFFPKIFPFSWFTLANFLIAKPDDLNDNLDKTVSVVIAARNEKGNIDELLKRIPNLGKGTEVIFVEGHSTDGTYEKILESIKDFKNFDCKVFKQEGEGKGDAVRFGFEKSKGEILMILDADMTVEPEELKRFYEIIISGKGEFVNGVRLIYPYQDQAMRFANLIGNKFFAMAFTWLLGQPIKDTLCGTKVLLAEDYKKISKNRNYFGDFDPFGDFDLLFGAAKLNLKIVELPIRYKARKYGTTNISRWRHGFLLLQMVIFAARRIKFY